MLGKEHRGISAAAVLQLAKAVVFSLAEGWMKGFHAFVKHNICSSHDPQ
jgi:hypothetical protein